jgi:GNAT superfamily N-acetyltransferase
MIEYRYLRPEDAEAAADIHIEGQPGTVLTQLGRPFLVQLYQAVCYSRWGEGIGAFDNGRLVGQTAMAVSSTRFFSEFKWRYLWRVSLPVAMTVVTNPNIISNVIKGWSYSDQTRSPEREGDVIFLGVTRDYARHGLGPEIVRYMFGWANLVGLTSANLMVEKRNRPMRWMIGQLNDLYVSHEFEAYGRTMLFYKVPIAANIADAKLPAGQPTTHAYIYPKNYPQNGSNP